MTESLLSRISYFLQVVFLCTSPRKWRQVTLENEVSPLSYKGLIWNGLFCWTSPIIAIGYVRPLQISDVWQLRESDSAEATAERLKKLWSEENRTGRNSLKLAVWSFIKRRLYIGLAYQCGWLIGACVSSAYLLREIILYFSRDEPFSRGLLFCVFLLLVEILRSVCVNHQWINAVLNGVHLRSALRVMLFEKMMRLRKATLSAKNSPISLVVADTGRVLEACRTGQYVIIAPVSLLVLMSVQMSIIGPSSIVGFVLLILGIPLQIRISSLIGSTRRKTAQVADSRVQSMKEIIEGMKLVKLYSYERNFSEKVADVRVRELRLLRRSAALRLASQVLIMATPIVVTFATFFTYVSINGNTLTADQAYVVLCLFIVAKHPLDLLGESSKSVSEGLVALQRLREFLLLPEMRADDMPVTCYSGFGKSKETKISAYLGRKKWDRLASGRPFPADDVAIAASETSLVWNDSEEGNSTFSPATEPFQLSRLNFAIYKGQLVAVVGPVGAGKSALLSALLGELRTVEGCLYTRGSVSYCPQVPWIFSGSVAENILFGDPSLDSMGENDPIYAEGTTRYPESLSGRQKRLQEVLEDCALLPDLAILPGGVRAEIGERGINLSGGQKARIALARAVFADADVLLLDDPLAAVDAHVARHLWRHVVEKARQQGKTVLICTHQTQFLQSCDRVLELQNGVLKEKAHVRVGNIDEIVVADGEESLPPPKPLETDSTPSNSTFLMRNITTTDVLSPEDTSLGSTPNSSLETASELGSTGTGCEPVPHLEASGDVGREKGNFDTPFAGMPGSGESGESRLLSPHSATVDVRPIVIKPSTAGTSSSKDQPQGLVAEERRATGSVSVRVFTRYFAAAGGYSIVGLLAAVLLFRRVSVQSMDWYISHWTASPTSTSDSSHYLLVYFFLSLTSLVAAVLQGLFFMIVTLRASRTLHNAAFLSVLRTPLQWFSTQPIGRLLQYFTGDLDVLDSLLPPVLESGMENLTQCVLAILTVFILLPWFLVVLVLFLLLFVFVARLFQRSARELKRLDGAQGAPLLGLWVSTASGLECLRSFGESPQKRLLSDNLRYVDRTARTWWAHYASNRWLGIRVDFLAAVLSSLTALGCVALKGSRWALNPGQAGLAVSYALSLASFLQLTLRMITEIETHFTAVERLLNAAENVPKEEEDDAAFLTEAEAATALQPFLKGYTTPSSSLSRSAQGDAIVSMGTHTSSGSASKIHTDRPTYEGWDPVSWNHYLLAHDWPQVGELRLQNLCARYRDSQPLVLEDITVRIPGGHSCAVVGRTGSGKSSLALALFRALPLARGSIHLDGVDTLRLRMSQLRSVLSIIPQDPTLFKGTIRSNLDPFGTYSDAEAWEALEAAGAAATVRCLDGGLSAAVVDGGGNLSGGERQLLCVARALLRRARVVVLDEATSATNAQADEVVQKGIRRGFSKATLIVIAHRLNTVMHCDRVIGLDKGRLVEFGTPARLLGLVNDLEEPMDEIIPDPNFQIFSKLVNDTGEQSAALLKKMALDAYPQTVQKWREYKFK